MGGNEPFLIAEVGQNHDGSLGAAHAYIDAIAKTGAHAVKFQTHIACAESSAHEPWRVRFGFQDATRYDYWKRMEFSERQWIGLLEHSTERGLVFLSSPFSLEAVELLDRIGIPAWKVGSGEVTNLPMLERIAQTGKPVLISSGMSTWEELDEAVLTVRRRGATVVLMQCTSLYPCPPDKLGLNILAHARDRYDCPVGLSDHSGTTYGGLAAVALGAQFVEVHVTFSRDCFGPDVATSITISELKDLAQGIKFIHTAVTTTVDKQAMVEEMPEMRRVFGKSIFAARDLPAGLCLTERDLAFRKPGIGIPARRYRDMLNRPLRRAVMANEPLKEDDLEPAQPA